ncbi:MAG: pilus assembly protein TadG-related protein [Kiloniellales bacterium]
MAGLLGRFCADRRAAVAVLLSVAIVPLMALLGVATDAGRAYMVQMRLSQAVDSAALAGGRAFSEAYQANDIDRYFVGNFPSGYLDATVQPLTISVNEVDGTVEVIASAEVPTTFLRVVNVDQITVKARAVVKRAVRGMELAMVLDVTGSMAGSKITSLRNAANSLVEILYGDRETVNDLWVAVVPFAARVNFQPHDDWMQSLPSPWNGCGNPRSGALATNDAPPSSGKWPQFDGRPGNIYYGCPSVSALPLTAEKSTITATIDALEAAGSTRTDIGMVWGWRVLSPQWRDLWGGDPTLPLDYDTPLMEKVAIIMTDGENTPQHTYDPLTVSQTNNQLAAECTAMKAQGITIYTITFQAPSSLDTLYRNCASDPTKFFKSPTNEDLEKTFKIIGAELSNLRLAE